ncbi:uncharacterized protein DUF2817 [Dongia mobilis]|uniref:Uncharacterized protein DUF2817 n=1 Tax=Dongia mobilis TaxID=578943 RepID=A0A4R6WSH2_9PROT|nr:M14 family metallopeptidase [Dongia mobilis]TDQ84602.1 uncharacterized protein DUF2817 [Dongia mobilis]
MRAVPHFSATYAEARDKFLAAARAHGAVAAAHVNPTLGPDGGELATDTALIGRPDAPHLLIAMSATHGVEGFCGSAIQTAWLAERRFADLPADTAVLLIHAINPHGFAWVRRVNEDNIDLNRNFIDHTKPYPENPGYRELRDYICPPAWDDATLAVAEAKLADYAARHSAIDLQAAIMNGQYWDKEGVFYGGNAPNWSHRTLLTILAPFADSARYAAFIDLHTGLGPSGYGEIISNHFGNLPGAGRVRDWFGSEATMIDDGSSTSTAVTGDTQLGVNAALPRTAITGITLEYGTVSVPEMTQAVRADNWLHIHGDLESELGRRIKRQIRDAFYTDTAAWKEAVIARAMDVLDRTRRGLAGAAREAA